MVRLADWPRMPYLNDEVREWAAQQLVTLGVDEIAVYAHEAGAESEQRRLLVATEIGLLDLLYGPRGSSARYGLAGRLYPWQSVRGVDLRVDTYRVWAHEHRTRWSLTMLRPRFRQETDSPELGTAICDFAKVCAIMAEPSGWPPPEEHSVANLPRDRTPGTASGAPAAPPQASGRPTGPGAARPGSSEPRAEGSEPREAASATATAPRARDHMDLRRQLGLPTRNGDEPAAGDGERGPNQPEG
jgi:hypothetical protein